MISIIKSNSKGILLASITAVLWGVLAVALKIALNYFDSYTIIWVRFLIAFVVMVVYLLVSDYRRLKIIYRPPLILVAGSILLGVNYIGFMEGIHFAGPGITQIFIQTGPIVFGLLGFIIFHERLTLVRAIGFALAGLGFVFFYYQQLNNVLTESPADINKGIIWVLIGALAWVGFVVSNKLLVKTHRPLDLNLIYYGIPVIGFAFFADYSSLLQSYPWWLWLLMLFLGLNTVVSYGALSLALKYIESNKISIIITVNPIITFLLLELLLYFNVKWFPIDAFSSLAYLGAFLVLVGAVLAIGVFRKKR
jgi:drug/metabolite transporter (DMT)-like permease